MPEIPLQQAFEIAGHHLQAGRLTQAEGLYQQILQVLPGHPDVLHHLGIVASQMGRNEVAVEYMRQALPGVADPAAALSNLGLAQCNLGRLDEAHASLTRALELRSGYPEALSNLGIVLFAMGRLEEATAAQQQAAALRPNFLQPKVRLIDLAVARDRAEEAVEFALGVLRQFPDHPVVLNALGNAYDALHRLPEALEVFTRAVALQPDMAEAQFNRGNILKDLGRFDEAAAVFRAALDTNPNLPAAHNNLGIVLCKEGELDDGLDRFRQALHLDPKCAAIYNNLGGALKDIGEHAEALGYYLRALELQPMMVDARSNLLLSLHYPADPDRAEIFAAHRAWDRVQAEPLRAAMRPHGNDRDPQRRLRIGYVSPDLHDHPVGRLLLPILQQHDRAAVEVIAYAQLDKPDEVTERLRENVAEWRDVRNLSDAEVAEQVRADAIDILVDLAGHTRSHRLLMFARKPAPLQVSYLGYPNTTGMSAIDYRLSDHHADPEGADPFCVEELIRLDPCAWCFSPLPDVPAARTAGPVTFGTFNHTAKVTDSMLRVWARILRELPESRLLLKAFAWRSDIPQRRVRALFAAEGVAAERIELCGDVLDYEDHLAFHGRLDIALDTFPYHGTNMTFEALWMGTPVITLAGDSHVSRVGVSLLSNAGHPEWIAHSQDEYVAKAVALARDPAKLAALHHGLRDELVDSPLMDGAAMAKRLEAAYRTMWNRWVKS